jgi:hypothetical protein
MTDDVAASPASPGPAEGAGATPTETAAAGLQTLAANKDWQADFNGDNGRPAQLAAAKLKSETTRAAFKPEADTAPSLPEKIEGGLDAPDAITRAAAEAMTPAQSPSDFSFQWKDSANIEISELRSMDEVAKQAGFDVGANPHFAQVTLAAMDAQLSKPEGSYTPTTSDALDSHLKAQLGDKADATLQGALATFEKMSPDAQAWLQSSLSKLDTSTASWVVQRLAAVNRATGV